MYCNYDVDVIVLHKSRMTPALGLLRRQNIPLSSSSRSSSVAVQKINDNLSFMPASSAHIGASSAHLDDASRRPIVLIYAWLTAKLRHVHKYADLYLGMHWRAFSYYRATANAYARSCYRHLSVRLSIRLSNACIVTKLEMLKR